MIRWHTGTYKILTAALLCAAFMLSNISPSYAACSNPTGTQGEIIYNNSQGVFQGCKSDNTWQALHGSVGGSGAGNAVNFDGSTYLSSDNIAGASDSTQWTGSFWFKSITGTSQVVFDTDQGSTGGDTSVTIFQGNNAANIRFYASNSANTNILDVTYNVINSLDTDYWHHVMWSFDLSDGTQTKLHIAVDGLLDPSPTIATWTNDSIDFDTNDTDWVNIGRSSFNNSFVDGDIADFWMDSGTYIDLSVESNREKFLSSGKPVDLGADGSTPTGSAPDIFLSGATASWHTNKGTGGGFTENGTLTDASSSPSSGNGNGYFVLIGNGPSNAEAQEFDGNLGGLSGADATCLSYLQTYDWLGKTDATNRGMLTAGNVKAWLCDESSCQNMQPNSSYAMATTQISYENYGGVVFFTEANGYIDTYNWGWMEPWGINRVTYTMNGRSTDQTSPVAGKTCNSWTSNNSGDIRRSGYSNTTGSGRWNNTDQTCATRDQYFCFVNPINRNCSNPAGALGEVIYNTSEGVLQGCTSNGWQALHATSGGGNGGDPILTKTAATASTTNIDLTAEGTFGWAEWAVPLYTYDSGGVTSQKPWPVTNSMSGGESISATWGGTTHYGGVGADRSETVSTKSWTNGTPTASGSDIGGFFVWETGSGTGFWYNVTLPADTTLRKARLYLGVWRGAISITAHLSDSSAADVTDSSTFSSATYEGGYIEFDYAAASSGQTLVITVTQTSNSGNGGPELRGVTISAGNCANPTGSLGEIIYNTSANVFQGCTAGGWQALHQ